MSRRRVLVVGLADEGFLALTADGTAGRGPAAAGVDSGALSRTLRGVGLGWQARLEPQGIVEPGAEYEAVVENLRARRLAFRDPATGAPVVTAVHRREEAYHGPHADGGPDLLVETARTVCMVEGLGRLRLMPAGVGPEERTGDHARDGILVLHGPEVRAGTVLPLAAIEDVGPTVLHEEDQARIQDMLEGLGSV